MAAIPTIPATEINPPRDLPALPPRAMTRCECSGVAFAQVAREVLVEGRPLGEVLRRTGCGQTCEACRPDLDRYLAARR